jgi:hypothetical protein
MQSYYEFITNSIGSPDARVTVDSPSDPSAYTNVNKNVNDGVTTWEEFITNSKIGSEQGMEFPNLGEFFENPNITLEDVRPASRHPVINATIRKIEKFIFEGMEPLAVPPDEIANTVTKEQQQEVQTLVETVDKFAMKTPVRVKQAWRDVRIYGPALFEVLYGNIKGLNKSYKGPVVFKRLPVYSFNEQPAQKMDPETYVAGDLVKGIIFNMKTQEYEFYQKQTQSQQPKQLKTENILMIKNETADAPDGESVIATLVPLIRRMAFADKALTQNVNRKGAPALDVVVHEYRDQAAPMNPDAWPTSHALTEAKKIGRNWGKDTVLAHPDCIELKPMDWTDNGLNPMEVVNFYNERILYALIPRDFTENKGIAISNTGTSSLDMLNLWARGEQHEIEEPFLRIWDKILEENGFPGWRVEFVWKEMTPDSGDQLFNRMRVARDVGVFTPDEMREMVEYPPLTEDQRKEIERIPAKGNNPGDKLGFVDPNGSTTPKEDDKKEKIVDTGGIKTQIEDKK